MDIKLKTTATINELNALKIENNQAIMTSSQKEIDLSERTIEQGAFGKFVSKEFANEVFNGYQDVIKTAPSTPFDKNVKRVFFSRELIDLILSQSGCQGISVYYVYPPIVEQINAMTVDNIRIKESEIKRHLSVLILGNDAKGKPLVNIESKEENSVESVIVEVGGPPPFEIGPEKAIISRTTGIDYLSLLDK